MIVVNFCFIQIVSYFFIFAYLLEKIIKKTGVYVPKNIRTRIIQRIIGCQNYGSLGMTYGLQLYGLQVKGQILHTQKKKKKRKESTQPIVTHRELVTNLKSMRV